MITVARNTGIGGKYIFGDNGERLEVKPIKISCSSSGDNTIVSLVSDKKIRVLSWDLISNGIVNVKWKSSSTTELTGLYYLIANTGIAKSFTELGFYFETSIGEALVLNLSAAIAVGGSINYVEV